MPVRTRSQRLREEKGESAVNVSQSAPRRTTRKQRSSKRSRKQQESNYAIQEMKSEEEVDYQQAPISNQEAKQAEEEQHFDADDEDDLLNSNAHIDEFRKYVKTILDTPDKHDVVTQEVDMDELRRQDQLSRQQQVTPSPRIDRITIKNKRNVMEFLIPPKQTSEPMEIRREIQDLLSPNDTPQTGALLDDITPMDKSKSPSLPYNSANPHFHEDTHLWSPNVPGYDEKNGERISRMLITILLTIMLAVLIMQYQDEMVAFLKKTFPSFRIESVEGIIEGIKQWVMQLFTAANIESNNEELETPPTIDDTVNDDPTIIKE